MLNTVDTYSRVVCLLSVLLGLLIVVLHHRRPVVVHVIENHQNIPKAAADALSGTTGRLYRIQHTRKLPSVLAGEFREFGKELSSAVQPREVPRTWARGPRCEKWVVVTTIWKPSRALKQAAALPNWCMVVVLDKKTPTPFELPSPDRVVILGVNDQTNLPYRIIPHLPWNHFGRKNVGFLYAVAHGAKVVYDCDDDNELIVENDPKKSIPLELDNELRVTAPLLETFNPYPVFGNQGGWPRGFPLDQIQNATTRSVKPLPRGSPLRHPPVHQSLVNNDPDYDALHRLTRPLPVTFTSGPAVVVAPGTFVPYNAQATLHFYEALWGMLLPITVHGRVSDIWRSYVVQRLLWDIGDGSGVVFRPPWVTQIRNAHNYLADFDSELPLYQKAPALIKFLARWRSDEPTLPLRFLRLIVDLYEHNIVELGDVIVARDWIRDLVTAGYVFPKLRGSQP
eukprot:RCo029880